MHQQDIKDAPDYEACMWGYTIPSVAPKHKIAEVHCYVAGASPGTLAHEFVHVAMEYLKHLGKDDLRESTGAQLEYEDRPEEILANAVAFLTDKALLGIQAGLQRL